MSKQSKRDRQRENREARRQYEETLARRRRLFKTARTIAFIAVPIIAVGAFLSLSSNNKDEVSPAVAAGCKDVNEPTPKTDSFTEATPTIDPTKTYDAVVQTSCGSFTIRLAPAEAPEGTNSFAFLADKGFYDNTSFYRVVKNFVAQGGNRTGPDYTLPEEPPSAGYQTGSVALTRGSADHSTAGDFFVVTADGGANQLNAQKNADGTYRYSVIGQVTDGFDTIQRINKLGEPDQGNPSAEVPKAVIKIDKVTVTEVAATP